MNLFGFAMGAAAEIFLTFLKWGRDQNKKALWNFRTLALKWGRRFLNVCVYILISPFLKCIICKGKQVA